MPLALGLTCQMVVGIAAGVVLCIVLLILELLNLVTPIVASGSGADQEVVEKTAEFSFIASGVENPNLVLMILLFATLSVVLLGMKWYKKYKTEQEFGLKELWDWKLSVSLLSLGVSLQLLLALCLNAVYQLLPQTLTQEYAELMGTLEGSKVLVILLTVILAPLGEEFLFRGVTMKKAEALMPFLYANVFQAVMFGVYHLNLIQGCYAFVMGMIFGYVARYFHSIWASVLLHACINAAAILLGELPAAVTETLYGIAGMAVTGILLLFMAMKCFPMAKKQRQTEKTEEIENFSDNSFDER